MKLITFTVPCYNSESYMRKCLDSLVCLGDDCEVIVVNDGSKDGTADIADEYAARYPSIVRCVHKENGGHGSGVNAGLRLATGLYFKVVDSDDWLNEAELAKLVAIMKRHQIDGCSPDLYIANYVYEHVEDNTSFTRSYVNLMPCNELFGWDDVKNFMFSEILMMHSLWYKTESVRRSGVTLPEHTYYVDDIFCYTPMPYMRTMFYVNADIYRYFIGRSDQSVNLQNAGKNYKMQLRVMKELVDAYDVRSLKRQSKRLYRYMLHCLRIFMVVTATFVAAKNTKEAHNELRELLKHIKAKDRWLYGNLFHRSYCMISRLPWPIAKRLLLSGYKGFNRRVKFG